MLKEGIFFVGVLGVVISATRGDNRSLEPKCYHRSTNSSTKCHHPPEPKCLSQFNYYWPHTTDRDKFTACENGVRSQKSCPEGKFFDPFSLKCDDDWNIRYSRYFIVDCKNTYVADSDHHYYYICRNGVPTLEYCPQPYIFNIYTNACVASEKCIGNMTYIVPDKNEQVYHKCQLGVKTTYKCPSYEYFHPYLESCKRKKIEIRPHQCVRDKTYNWPHETRSNLYYTCTNGTKMTNNCSNDKFSSVLLKCVPYITEMPCGPYKMIDLASGHCVWKNNVYFGFDQLPVTDTYQQHDCTDEEHVHSFPHETRSDMFYRCYMGRRIILSCPEGTMFHAGFTKCVSVHRTEVTGKCEAGVYSFRHERDNLYYNCDQGYKRILSCPSPALFDWEVRKCLYGKETDCNFGQQYHVDDNPLMYTYCTGTRWEFDTCLRDEPFHPKFRRCHNKEFCDPDRLYNETHEISPDLYYLCAYGLFSLQTCPIRMIFSLEEGRCVNAQKGNSTGILSVDPLQAMTTGRPAR